MPIMKPIPGSRSPTPVPDIDPDVLELERLRAVIRRAAAILRGGEGINDQGEAFDRCSRLLDATVKEFPRRLA